MPQFTTPNVVALDSVVLNGDAALRLFWMLLPILNKGHLPCDKRGIRQARTVNGNNNRDTLSIEPLEIIPFIFPLIPRLVTKVFHLCPHTVLSIYHLDQHSPIDPRGCLAVLAPSRMCLAQLKSGEEAEASGESKALVASPSRKLGFIDLPPEIRNKVYDLVIPSCRVLIRGNHPQRDLERYKKTHRCRRAPKFRYRLRSILLSDEDPLDLASAAALLSVCRAVRSEMTSLLYSSTTFCFTSIKHINKFLNAVPEAAKNEICMLEIAYTAYGEPLWNKDEYWKMKSDWKWRMVCTRMGNELPALRSLSIGIRMSDWPLCLSPAASCFVPLGILKGSGLERARVRLRHSRSHPDRCAAVARDLEDMMMTRAGRELRDTEDAIKAMLRLEELEAPSDRPPPRQAKRVLVIKDIAQVRNPSTKKYYRTKGLEGWSRIGQA